MEVINFWTNLANHPGWFKALTISGMIFWGCIIICIIFCIFGFAHASEAPDERIHENKLQSNEKGPRLV